ncbi:MAG: protein SCO1/2 [Myxococcota bacterium]|jgi:protein SCO1/2
MSDPKPQPTGGLEAQNSWIQRTVMKNPWVFFGVLGVILLTTMQLCNTRSKTLSPLMILGEVGEFSLIDQTGQPFGSEQLKGKVWVASFFFTSCQTLCPKISIANGEVQELFEEAGLDASQAMIVSFTVDPEIDTPERLTTYAKNYGADPARWRFLTGPNEVLFKVIAKRFQTAMGDKVKDAQGIDDITHSPKLVLVDAFGRIRHYFASDDPRHRELLVQHAIKLVADAQP